jgi:hypothetical protein
VGLKRKEMCIVLFWKREGKRPIYRLEYNMKMDLKEERWNYMTWIMWFGGRDKWQACVNIVMNLQVPKNVGNIFTLLKKHCAAGC